MYKFQDDVRTSAVRSASAFVAAPFSAYERELLVGGVERGLEFANSVADQGTIVLEFIGGLEKRFLFLTGLLEQSELLVQFTIVISVQALGKGLCVNFR